MLGRNQVWVGREAVELVGSFLVVRAGTDKEFCMRMKGTTLPFGSSHRIDTGDVGWYWPGANAWLSNPFDGSKLGLGDMAIDGVALGFSPNPAGTTGWCPPP